jgi:hypothetical protein
MKWLDKLRDALHPLALWAALARVHEEAEALRRVAEEERARADAAERELRRTRPRAKWHGSTVFDGRGAIVGSVSAFYEGDGNVRASAYWNLPLAPSKYEECASVEEARAAVERGLSEWCDVEPEAGS